MNRFLSVACLILLSFTVALFLWGRKWRSKAIACEAPRSAMPAAAASNSPLALPPVGAYTDGAGKQHKVFDATAHAAVKRGAERVAEPIVRKIDSVARAAGVKPREVESYTAVQMGAAMQHISFLEKRLDSMARVVRRYRDPYVTLAVRDPAPGDTTDLGSFDLSYNADLTVVDYTKRRRILGVPVGPRRYYTDISSSDPRLQIKGAEKFTMERRMPPLGLRIQTMATLNPRTLNYLFGLGARVDVGDKFNGGFNYFYNPQSKLFTPNIYVKYDLLQFGR